MDYHTIKKEEGLKSLLDAYYNQKEEFLDKFYSFEQTKRDFMPELKTDDYSLIREATGIGIRKGYEHFLEQGLDIDATSKKYGIDLSAKDIDEKILAYWKKIDSEVSLDTFMIDDSIEKKISEELEQLPIKIDIPQEYKKDVNETYRTTFYNWELSGFQRE